MSELGPSALAEMFAALARPLTVFDVGCRWGPADKWAELGPEVRLVGFDPDEQECAALAERYGADGSARFVPLALGRASGTAEIHLTEEAACSSLFPPRLELVTRRPALSLISPVGSRVVGVVTLDEWMEKEPGIRPDFIKIDTQGSELGVLQGAERALTLLRAVEVEVEFNPIYEGQPLFGDVDAFLRRRGFVLWRLADLAHYGLPGALSEFERTEFQHFDRPPPVEFQARGGQLFWANAFYVKEDLAMGRAVSDFQEALRDACVSAANGFWDLAIDRLRGAPPPDAPGELPWLDRYREV